MKIIGKNKEGLLAVVTEYEIARIHGFKSIYDDGWKELKNNYERTGNRTFEFEGIEFDVNGLSEKVHYLRQKEDSVKSAIQTFRQMADALELAWPTLKNIERE